jgi:hypothetical protein
MGKYPQHLLESQWNLSISYIHLPASIVIIIIRIIKRQMGIEANKKGGG